MSIFSLFVNHKNPGSFVNRMRKDRFLKIQKNIEDLIQEKGTIKILDIGGEIGYWKNIGWQNEHTTIYLLNLDTGTTLKDEPGFIHISGNALHLPYEQGAFDLVFSNSVIEHVGSKENQQVFANEVRRVCGRYIVQTPSFWFPLEPHSLLPLFQFIPHSLRAYLIMWFNINYFPKAATYAEALTVSKSTIMFSKSRFQQLFPEATMQVEKLMGIPKSYTVIKQ
ncbi:MAG: methyltransferase domain-containing protein [Bacteroidota bacterium]